MSKLEVVFGVPGSGKTTHLLKRIGKLMEQGYTLSDIAYFTMTRNARTVARNRLVEQYNVDDKEAKNSIRTMHSMCWELIGRPNIITEADRISFCKKVSTHYVKKIKRTPKTKEGIDDTAYEPPSSEIESVGELYFKIHDSLRLIKKKDAHSITEEEFKGFWVRSCERVLREDRSLLHYTKDIRSARIFMKKWEEYKEEIGKVDYEDMLYHALVNEVSPEIKVLIIDEFQDFSPLMYAIYELWKRNREIVIIAGDDDQAIYGFTGASPTFLLTEKEVAEGDDDSEVITLNRSYRCPKEIIEAADRIIRRNKNRHSKTTYSEKGNGKIMELYNPTIFRVVGLIDPKKKTFMIMRTNAKVKGMVNRLIKIGRPFRLVKQPGSWSDKFIRIINGTTKMLEGVPFKDINKEEFHELLLALPTKPYLKVGIKTKIKNGEELDVDNVWGLGYYDLTTRTKIASALKITETQKEILSKWDGGIVDELTLFIGTIHSTPGDEADTVILDRTLPKNIIRSIQDGDGIEEERRVLYTAMTRTKEFLVFIRNEDITKDIGEF